MGSRAILKTPKISRDEIIPILLRVLQRGTETTAALLRPMMAGYAESRRRLYRLGREGVTPFDGDWAESYRVHQRFYKLLNHLQREGLIVNEGARRRGLWRLTKKGFVNFSLRLQKKRSPAPSYAKKRDGKWRVVMYDVPERERHKRMWIRRALTSLGFSFLQGSVWVGTSAISKAFLDDLRAMEMLSYVQIFEVSRRGTIARVKGGK